MKNSIDIIKHRYSAETEDIELTIGKSRMDYIIKKLYIIRYNY